MADGNQFNTKKKFIEPTNKLEAQFLNNQKINSLHNNIWVEKLEIQSALNDLQRLEENESGWPTKEVVIESPVTYPCRLTNTMVSDTTQRVVRVPMELQEGLAELNRRIHEKQAIYQQMYPEAFQLPMKPKKARKSAAPKEAPAKEAPKKATAPKKADGGKKQQPKSKSKKQEA